MKKSNIYQAKGPYCESEKQRSKYGHIGGRGGCNHRDCCGRRILGAQFCAPGEQFDNEHDKQLFGHQYDNEYDEYYEHDYVDLVIFELNHDLDIIEHDYGDLVIFELNHDLDIIDDV